MTRRSLDFESSASAIPPLRQVLTQYQFPDSGPVRQGVAKLRLPVSTRSFHSGHEPAWPLNAHHTDYLERESLSHRPPRIHGPIIRQAMHDTRDQGRDEEEAKPELESASPDHVGFQTSFLS